MHFLEYKHKKIKQGQSIANFWAVIIWEQSGKNIDFLGIIW